MTHSSCLHRILLVLAVMYTSCISIHADLGIDAAAASPHESHTNLPLHNRNQIDAHSYQQTHVIDVVYSAATRTSIPSSTPPSDSTYYGSGGTELVSADASSTGQMASNTTAPSTFGNDRGDVVEWILIPVVSLTLFVVLLIGMAIWQKIRQPKQQTKQVQPAAIQVEKVIDVNGIIPSSIDTIASHSALTIGVDANQP